MYLAVECEFPQKSQLCIFDIFFISFRYGSSYMTLNIIDIAYFLLILNLTLGSTYINGAT